jgi:hypothetical protein
MDRRPFRAVSRPAEPFSLFKPEVANVSAHSEAELLTMCSEVAAIRNSPEATLFCAYGTECFTIGNCPSSNVGYVICFPSNNNIQSSQRQGTYASRSRNEHGGYTPGATEGRQRWPSKKRATDEWILANGVFPTQDAPILCRTNRGSLATVLGRAKRRSHKIIDA